MDNAGPLFATDARKAVTAMSDQRIDQRPVGISGSWVDHKACGFVDHEQVFVLKHDVEGNVFALGLGRACRWDFQGQAFGRFDPVIGVRSRLPACDQATFSNKRLDTRARQFRERFCQHLVEPGAGFTVGYVMFKNLSFAHILCLARSS